MGVKWRKDPKGAYGAKVAPLRTLIDFLKHITSLPSIPSLLPRSLTEPRTYVASNHSISHDAPQVPSDGVVTAWNLSWNVIVNIHRFEVELGRPVFFDQDYIGSFCEWLTLGPTQNMQPHNGNVTIQLTRSPSITVNLKYLRMTPKGRVSLTGDNVLEWHSISKQVYPMSTEHTYQVGDWVWEYTRDDDRVVRQFRRKGEATATQDNTRAPKLAPAWRGPWQVTEIPPEVSITIVDPMVGGRSRKVHVRDSPTHGQTSLDKGVILIETIMPSTKAL
ncbi:hypothetical protein M434DRAFT_373273 [Hypoxylon sp. CO27-5]|nr:hypothetical protein M434DRAFT_373273 [Hypoxylon sp. CO27-5]